MQLNQVEFLGHHNVNGNTRSISELQKEQQKFWTDVYLVMIAKSSREYALGQADASLKLFNERFIPPLPPTNYSPTWQTN